MPSKHRTPALIASLGLSLTALTGCWVPGYYPGGSLASRDLYTYESTPDTPKNITVVDWTTGEQLLTVEVPVGQQLVVRFYEGHDKKNTERPDLMRWKLMARGTTFGELDNSMPVPDITHRRVDVSLRTNAAAVPKPLPAAEPVTK